jgi:hypothetical protein
MDTANDLSFLFWLLIWWYPSLNGESLDLVSTKYKEERGDYVCFLGCLFFLMQFMVGIDMPS